MTTQDQVAGQSQNTDGSQFQQGEHSFMNHQVGEHCHTIHENTRSKRRAVDDFSSTPTNKASTLATTHAPISSVPPRATEQPRPNLGSRLPNPLQTDPIIPTPVPVISKPQCKPINTPLNIIEKMKKTTLSVPMWDVLAMPSQLELL